ncbi:PEPxxWA-CTERM sorting domain-containing protein [Sphingorhabdus sp. Alg231-15]|uniref:PEPxxWA-CTERM sorting domain-containing protein n=1 Tax=Sphingorhabdus sp. Alg231-15 TaxID=1922222 RepID=UPI000D55DB20
MKKYLLAAAAAACLSVPSVASAAIITETLGITGSDYQLSFGDPSASPVDPTSIIFSVTFDNSADISGTTTGLNILSATLPYAAQFAYSSGSDTLTLATNANPNSCGNPAESFCIFINSFSTAPNASFVQQSTASGGYWRANTVATSAVPEPATWAFMILGFGAMGGTLRSNGRRQRKANVKVSYA